MSQRTAGKVIKALYAAAVAFLGGLAVILSGKEPFSSVTAGQWVSLILAALVAAGGTFGLAGWAGPPPGAHINANEGEQR